MNRETLVERIKRFHAEMRKLTVEFAKVSERTFDRAINHVDQLDDLDLLNLHEWLRGLYQGQFAVVQRIYNLVPNPEVAWDNYRHLEVEGLQEQIMMEREAPRLRELWRFPFKPRKKEKDKVSKRGKKADTAESEEPAGHSAGVGVRSSGHRSDESNY